MGMRGNKRMVLLLIAVAAVLAVIGVGVSIAAPSYKIGGTVSFTEGDWAHQHIVATAYKRTWDDSTLSYVYTTVAATSSVEASGSYSLNGLDDGYYKIGFADSSNRYQSVYYDTTSTLAAAKIVTVNGENVTAIDQAVVANPTPGIVGTVTHTDGDWVDASLSVVVAKLTTATVGGSDVTTWSPVESSVVATDGTFRVTGLDAGANYRVAVIDAAHVYGNVYYPAASSWSGATDVAFDGATDTSITVALTALPQRKVGGKVSFVGGTPVSGDITADLYTLDASGTATMAYSVPVADDGTYVIHPTADGSYKLGFSDTARVFLPVFYGGGSTVASAPAFDITTPASLTVDAVMTAQTSTRTTGIDGIATALSATAAFDDGYCAMGDGHPVVITTADSWADAVSAGPYAKSLDAPLLLIHKARVPSEVIAELERLDASEIIIVGNPTAITFTVEQDLRQAGYPIVRRLAGNDAFATSAAVAQEQFTRGLVNVDTDGKLQGVIVVGGSNGRTQAPYDAMCAAPLAAAKGMPLVLVKKTSVPEAVADFLASAESTNTDVTLIGGEGVVSADLESQLTPATDPAVTLTRISGANRYATSVAVAQYAASNFGFSDRRAAIAAATDYASAFAMSPVLAEKEEALLLTAPALKRVAVKGFPGAYTYLSPSVESFITKAAAFADAEAKFNLGLLDSVGTLESDVWVYAKKIAVVN